jgi:2-C-methyl-D-erythritol 4-phosphate cytidylyltransferase
MRVTAIIVAAGEGARMGGAIPKPFISVHGRPLILRTLDRFSESRTVERVILVVASGQCQSAEEILRSSSLPRDFPWELQSGGATRQESVRRGLARLEQDCEFVVIHDGVRPFVSPNLIDRCVEEAYEKHAVVVGVPVRDTIKVISVDRWVQATPARNSLWEIQTPQVFRKGILLEAHEQAHREGAEGTDDAVLVERLGRHVFVIEGERTNIKITMPEDLLLAESLLRAGLVC